MIYAWIGAIGIGLSLGLMGSGGSILTVPVLVYLLGHAEKAAIAESLAIVGAIAAVAAVPFGLKRRIDWRSVLYFGVPGMGGTYLGAALSRFVSGEVQLLLFAAVMVLAAVLMFRGTGRGTDSESDEAERPRSIVKVMLDGLLVGVLTGLVGVGGGFLIVPALVLLGGLPMHTAVGTSLVIIALKSATGFGKYLSLLKDAGIEVDWSIIGLFAAVGVVGSLVGSRIGAAVDQERLRRVFAGFLVVMSGIILWREIPDLLSSSAF